MDFSEEEKLKWEIRRLQAETKRLSQPFIRQPTFWFGLVTLSLSMATNVYQHSKAVLNEKLAEIKTSQLELETTELEHRKRDVEAVLMEQRTQLASVSDELQRQQQRLDEFKQEVSTTQTNREHLLATIAGLEEKANGLKGLVETTSRELSRSSSGEAHEPRDVDRAKVFEHQAFAALAQQKFDKAHTHFLEAEKAASGYHFCYEWARHLEHNKDKWSDPHGRRSVLHHALAKGYASFAAAPVRHQLHSLATAQL